jgi:4-hydroxybenzoate polyprenyltransferase
MKTETAANFGNRNIITSIISRWAAFARKVYEPKLHLLFALLWSLSLQGLLVLGQQTLFDWKNLAVAISFFLVLFYLRAIDEIKDLDYDRVYNPDRPLVDGTIGKGEVWGLIGLLAGTILSLNLMMHPFMVLLTCFPLFYGLLLILMERSNTVKDNMLLNLMVTFPVSASLNVYALLFLVHQKGLVYEHTHLLVILAYMAAFLHFEFGRKTQWRSVSEPGERFYSQVLGNRGAQAVCQVLGITALILVFVQYLYSVSALSPVRLVVLIALLPSLMGVAKFFTNQNQRIKPRPYYVAYLALFYFSNLLLWFF